MSEVILGDLIADNLSLRTYANAAFQQPDAYFGSDHAPKPRISDGWFGGTQTL
jgi:hypothetical protein